MKSVHVCPPITLSFGLSYTLMRLRRSVLRRSRRIPERRIVEKLSMFSSYVVFFSFIVFFILLSSYSYSSSPSPSLSLFFTHLQFFFSLSFQRGAMQEKRMFQTGTKTRWPFIRRLIPISNANTYFDERRD